MAKPDPSSPLSPAPKEPKPNAGEAELDRTAAAVRTTMGRFGVSVGTPAPESEAKPSEQAKAGASDPLAEMRAQLAELLAEKKARDEQATAAAQTAVDKTPPKVLGSITVTDRMSEAEILRQIRAARTGHIPFEDAKRFRTCARIYPPASLKDRAADKGAGTMPIGTELDREAFSASELEHYLAPHVRALVAIA